MDEIVTVQAKAAMSRRAEQLVRDQVLAEIFRDLPASPSSRLKGGYYQLLTSTSPVAFAAVWRHGKGRIAAADLAAAGRHHVRFGE
ncbi:hypothetical protein OOJ09_12720 [Mesorhizobium qingshengii]|uniref:Uncharacterized protein n=1 Tax=Mesorhizobium qingshengii TaxID=1165689 RepID=A0ABT4QUK3_9HYPH|nr:hypothetical protein [Mesorhizobium qingshengii]MCZ8545049.1 hypothetical protein [Mesorhizobium qingshengii]